MAAPDFLTAQSGPLAKKKKKKKLKRVNLIILLCNEVSSKEELSGSLCDFSNAF